MGCVVSTRGLREELENAPIGVKHFRLGRVLGEGGFGSVRAVRRRFDPTEQWFAMKILPKQAVVDRRRFEEVFRERDLLTMLRHDRICNMHYAFQDADYLYLVMDNARGGDLRYQLNNNAGRLPFAEWRTRIYAAQLVEALDFVHSRGVIHRDVKPENVLMSSTGWVMLTDFGIAQRMDEDGLCFSGSGTAGYMAPELYSRRHTHDRTADWFALGVMLHELMTKRRPFHGDDMRRAARARRVLSESRIADVQARPQAISDADSNQAQPASSEGPDAPSPLPSYTPKDEHKGGEAGVNPAAAAPAPLTAGGAESCRAVAHSLSRAAQTSAWRRMPVEHLARLDASGACIELLQRMLCFDRHLRLGRTGAAEFRAHPWFRDSSAFSWARIADGSHPVPFVPSPDANVDPLSDMRAEFMYDARPALRKLTPEEQACFEGYNYDRARPPPPPPAAAEEDERPYRQLLRADSSRLADLPAPGRFAGGVTGFARRRSTRSHEETLTLTTEAAAGAKQRQQEQQQRDGAASAPAAVHGGAQAAARAAASLLGSAPKCNELVRAQRKLRDRQLGYSSGGGSGRSSGTSEAAAYSTTRSTQSEATIESALFSGGSGRAADHAAVRMAAEALGMPAQAPAPAPVEAKSESRSDAAESGNPADSPAIA